MQSNNATQCCIKLMVVISFISVASVSSVNETTLEYNPINSFTFNLSNNHEKALFSLLDEYLETSTEESCNIFKNYLRIGAQNNPTEDLKDWWVLKMIDSWSKIPSGILAGNIADNGQFDECFDLETIVFNQKIQGQYCNRAVTITVSKIPISLSICIPSTCKLKNYSPVSSPFRISNALCQVKGPHKEFDWDDWVVAGIFIMIVVTIIASTLYDCYLQYYEKKTAHLLLIAFSTLTNGKKLCTVSSNTAGQVTCLHGMRVFSLMWIIAGHRFVMMQFLPQLNMFELIKFKNGFASTYISSGRTAVDTFFIFSAFLVSYSYFKSIKSNQRKAAEKGSSHVENPLSLIKIPMFYIHRLFRVTPALLAAFLFEITLIRRIAEGPIMPYLTKIGRDACTEWWWTLFLYVQNYVNYDNMCIVPTWYLSADMQLYILAPFLLIPLGDLVIKGRNKLVYILLSFFIVMAIIIPLIVELFRDFVIDRIYETHHRISIYIIGIFFGLILVECTDKKIRISLIINLVLWGLSLGVMIGIILGMHTTETEPERVKNTLFFAFTRPLWALSLCWIVFACHFGYGGPVNWFLSLPIYTVMTRLSYSMYLLHTIVITVTVVSYKATYHFSEYEVIYQWSGDYIVTIVASILWVLCFESPIVGIEKVIFGQAKRRQSAQQNENKTDEQRA